MRSLITLGVLSLAVVGAQAQSQANLSATQRALEQQRQGLLISLRNLARERLIDSESALFSDERLYLSKDGSTLAACGMVNPKNAHGGYAGKGGYISTNGGLVLFERPGSSFAPSWETWCDKPQQGLSLQGG